MSHDCCVGLPCSAMVCLQFAMVFPDHTHLLFYIIYLHYFINTSNSYTSNSYKESFTFLNREHSHPEINILTSRCHMVNSDVTFLHEDVLFLQRVVIFLDVFHFYIEA